MKLKTYRFNRIKNTNDKAIQIIKKDNIKNGIIIANFQTKGRGTMGKKWVSYKGNLFVSIFFELKKNMPDFKEFSLINPIIIKNILKQYSSHVIKIKRPK